MKSLKLKGLVAIIAILNSSFSFSQSLIEDIKTLTIDASTILGKDRKFSYNLNNADTALLFIQKVILASSEVSSNKNFTFFINDSLKKSAIIFLRHGLDGNALLINKSQQDFVAIDSTIKEVVKRDRILIEKAKKIDSLKLLLKFKSNVSENDYDSIISLLKKGSDSSILHLEKNNILKNDKIKEFLIDILDQAKRKIEDEKKENILIEGSGNPFFKENKEIVKMVLHKANHKFSEYLLTTKRILLVILGGENDLQKAEISIKRNKSFFTQSFEDLKSIYSFTRGGVSSELPCKVIVLKSKEIKPPCELIIKQDSIKDISFTIHEKNTASFQAGVVNNKFQLNNFSLSGGNLVVKPDSTQKSNWKSSLYAALELHLPRDVDNFKSALKSLFTKTDSIWTSGDKLYDLTLSRMGIYGGFKISDDPLSNIHAGFNYAVSKELYVNVGWTWTNQVEPQVTQIGNITSLSDAIKYAKRKYSSGQFSWGLSFAPSTLIETLGLKKDDKKETAKN